MTETQADTWIKRIVMGCGGMVIGSLAGEQIAYALGASFNVAWWSGLGGAIVGIILAVFLLVLEWRDRNMPSPKPLEPPDTDTTSQE